MLPSAFATASAPELYSYAAQWLACGLPCRRFAAILAKDDARLGADVVRYSFIVSDFHRLLLAGLPAHCEKFWTLPRLNSGDVIDTLADAMIEHGIPEHIRSDNGPEFVAKDLRKWLAQTGAKTLYIEPGSPWENGYCESFNSKLRDEFLNGDIFYSLKEVQVLAERWRIYYNTERPHSSLGYRPPAPNAWQPEASQGHGKVESKQRLPLFHTPDYGDGLSNLPAALH